ncbi:acyltransferase [Penicillium freii]|nr:acyltransferase [Penicillium freii]
MLTVQCNLYDTTGHPGLQGHETILPAIRAWQMLGEIILILGLSSDNRLKRPFVSPATQYLRRISYGIYICYGLLLNIAHNPIFLLVWKFVAPEDESNTVLWAGFLIALPVLFLGLLLLTTAFYWLVYKPSNRQPG